MIFSIQEYNEAFVDDEDEYTPTPLPETGNEDPPIPERTQYKEPDVTPRTPDIFVRPDADLQQVSPHISPNVMKYSRTSLSRTRLFRITAYLEVNIWSLFYHGTMTKGNKIMWKRGEIAPKEQFLLFSTLFYIYISNFRSQITYSFVKCCSSIYCFTHSLNSDMSRYGYLEVFQCVPWNSR